MNASIAVCVMMVGGIIYPESEITTVPLNVDLSATGVNNIQDQEWQQSANTHSMPKVPTADLQQQSSSDGQTPNRNNLPIDQRAYHPRQSMIPEPPTSAGPAPNGQGYTPGAIGAGGIGAGGNGTAGGYCARNDLYPNAVPGRSPVFSPTTQFSAPTATPVQTVNNVINTANTSVNNLETRFGLNSPQYPTMVGPSAGPAAKPYSNYQPPSGYSPWMNLYQPTNNGTIDPYTAYVQPALNQQNFNAHVSEQINGVQNLQRGYGPMPGNEVPMGNGMADPRIFQNYKGYYPSPNQYPVNPYQQ